ncbi:hypothetical protein BYT27DRAFT_7157551 [Phlegmacium glaucopus]|nr:hypothetical protein BYT27DRAFT_7157551 [Phlegmacium glaucopus]
MLETKTSLRLLYTINSSPQYILARSHTTVSVTLVPTEGVANGDNAQPVYASVLLKTCLNTICRSSPELIQDHCRDFSLYVLDPLESNSAPAPVRIANANREPSPTKTGSSLEQPRGVAVGLGLMSWALASDDSDPMTVVGTIVKQGTGQEALEVIFALRETVAMKQPAWTASSTSVRHANLMILKQDTHRHHSSHQHSSQPVASSSRLQVEPSTSITRASSGEAPSYMADSTRETLASIHMRTKAKIKPPKKSLKQSTIPVTESDKLMNAETYIGPLKKKGRPKMINVEANLLAPQPIAPPSDSGAQEVIVIDGSDSDSTSNLAVKNMQVKSNDIRTPASQDTNKKNRRTKQPTTQPFLSGPLIKRATQSNGTHAFLQPKVESYEPSILDVLAYLSATSPSEPNAQNATILAALSSIDSSESLPQENTPNTGLVSALKHLLSLYSKSVNPEPGPLQKPPTSPYHDDGIVILDKENINPSKFQKKSEKDSYTRKLSDSSSTPSSGLHSTEQTSRPERHIQNLRLSSDDPFDNPLTKESISKTGSDRSVRKRTLSDFMDEKESCRNRGKGKERERVGRRHSHLQRAQKSASNDSLRHYPRFVASNQPRVDQPSSYYRTGMEPWSSPPRPYVTFQDHSVDVLSGVDISRKPQSPKVFASSPVRSVQAQQDARKKYIVPEWARTSTATQPRLSEDAQRALEEAEQKKKQEKLLARRRLSMQDKSKSKSASTLRPKKQQSGEDHTSSVQKPQTLRQPIAATSSGPLFAAANISFPVFASTRSPSPPNPSSILKTPKTPTRNRQPLRATPGGECDSLFTPVMRSGSLFGSANSHSSRTTLPQTFTSPLGNRKKAKFETGGSILQLKGAVLADTWSAIQSAEPKTKEVNEDLNAVLKQELENAFDDLDCPPSSLPIASSDIDVDEPHPQAFEDLDAIDADETETKHVTPFWPGLPPSSPPPLSSPMMLPEVPDFEFQTDDEMDDLELPVATDSETDADITAFDTDISSPSESPACCNDQNETISTTDDCSAYFPQREHSLDTQGNPASTMDVFEQFTHFNTGSDDLQGYVGGIVNSDLDAIFQNGLDGIDFTEFWETFKPLIHDNAKVIDNDGSDVAMNSFENIDHAKLADDMQTLLSGCLM